MPCFQAHLGEPTGSELQEPSESISSQSAASSNAALPATQALTDTGKQKESDMQLQAGWDTKPFLQSADGVYQADLRAYTLDFIKGIFLSHFPLGCEKAESQLRPVFLYNRWPIGPIESHPQ